LTPVRDLTFVTDTAAAFIAIAGCDAAVGRVVNIGNNKGISIGELATRILALMGVERNRRIVSDGQRVRPENSEVLELICDNTLAATLMGWGPQIALDAGLMQVIDYIGRHRGALKANIYNV
jgi:nucleoside-diphosphate-sugar epimerase